MSSFDSLLQSMRSRGANRAILVSDQPMTLEIGAATVQGAPLSEKALQSLLAAALPFDAYTQTLQQGQFEHISQSASGTVRVVVSRNGAVLRAVIEPLSHNPLAPPLPGSGGPPPLPGAPFPPQSGPYGVPHGAPVMDNTSGQGAMAFVPPEIAGKWNWGAFVWTWVWGIGHSSYLPFLCFVPVVGWLFAFVCGAKGNEWAWRNRRFQSVEQFRQTQRVWALTGIVPFLAFGIVIPAAVVFPVFGRARENARRSQCQSNLKQISLGILQYAQDYDEKLPWAGDMARLKSVTMPYIRSETVFQCPSDSHSHTQESYIWNSKLGGVSAVDINEPAWVPTVWEKTDHLGGHNVAFLDGHVKWFSQSSFDRLMSGS